MYTYRAKVVRVIDGDSLVVEVDLGFRVRHEVVLRLAGIDAPEMVGEDRAAGEAAKAFAQKYLAERPSASGDVIVKTQRNPRDKYGRYLAVVVPVADVGGAKVAMNENLNEAMVAAGHARPYSGGPR